MISSFPRDWLPRRLPGSVGRMRRTRAWRDKDHRWRIEVDEGPPVWVRIYATNAFTESAPLWLDGTRALARWLMLEGIGLDDLEELEVDGDQGWYYPLDRVR